MPGTVRATGRVAWLDGLRGLAAMQVVLQHYVYAFLPAVGLTYPLPVAGFGWGHLLLAPFGYLFDGGSAVYLFFIISGIVLTQAFAADPSSVLATATRRAIRLGLPMAAATLAGAALYALLPDAHARAGAQSGSPWLRYLGPASTSIGSVAHNIVFEGLLTGFDHHSLLPYWLSSHLHLADEGHGYDTPLWTMHVEFCGSLLIALLVTVRRSASQAAHAAICVVLGAAFVLSPLVLFVIGHVLAGRLRPVHGGAWRAILGGGLVAAGILLCTVQPVHPLEMLWRILPPPPLGIQGDAAILQRMTGAVVIFAGLVLLPVLQRQLQRPVPQWLGKVSFSVYLLHFPLAFTVVAAFFNLVAAVLPIGASVALTAIVGMAGSLALAVPFERWIDRPAIALSRMSARRFSRLDAASPRCAPASPRS